MVIIELANGKTIKLEMDRENAANTVDNFIWLASKGFYDGKIFHRVIKNFMIQGGCPNGLGNGGPGYCIKGEFKNNKYENNLAHTRGVISMARADHPDSAGSQFFIVHAPATPHLDGGYAAFGKVVEGIEVVDEIANVATNAANKPLQDIVIKSIKVIDEKINEPQKLNEIE